LERVRELQGSAPLSDNSTDKIVERLYRLNLNYARLALYTNYFRMIRFKKVRKTMDQGKGLLAAQENSQYLQEKDRLQENERNLQQDVSRYSE
jgi:hypothetical protein